MTHYDTLIRDFVLEHRSVTLDGIGTLTAAGDATPGSLIFDFTFDKRVNTSPELIEYISQQTGKNKTLIQSDLDSHFELTRQFINIGKPYELEGIGSISMSRDGSFVFTPYAPADRKEELKGRKNKPVTGPEPIGTRRSNRGILMLLALLIIVGVAGVIGWGVYNLFFRNDLKQAVDTTATVKPVRTEDTATNASTVVSDSPHVAADSANYLFYFERTFSRQRAIDRAGQLRVAGLSAGFDSVWADTADLYRLYVRMRLSPSDTAFMRDSMERYLQHSVKIVP